MWSFQRDRPCNECAKTNERLDELEKEMAWWVLRADELYEIARRNLAKMAQRAAGEDGKDEGDALSVARRALAERKLKGA